MKADIQYCVVWNYGPRATSLAAEIRNAYPAADVHLVEASGGLFEVTIDGELIFSKQKLGRHAEPGEVLELIRERFN